MPAIAQVEPLTTARALRGPFDYRHPGGAARRRRSARCSSCPSAGARSSASSSGSRTTARSPTSGCSRPRRALELGVPADLVALAGWIAARVLLDAGTRPRARAASRGPIQPAPRPLRRLVAELTPAATAARGRADGAAPAPVDRAAQVLAGLLDGPRAATATGADHGALRRLAARGLLRLSPRETARRPTHLPVGARRPQAPALTADQAAVLEPLERALRRDAASGCSCTASPARARPRSTCAPRRRRCEPGRGAIVLVPEIALTPQIVARFVERFGDTVAVLHSQPHRRRAARRVAAAAPPARRACASARARPCSRRSPTSG